MLSTYVKPVEALPVRRVNTVEFWGGYFSGTGGGASGQDSDTEQEFGSFDWELAEDNVDIVSAFIIVEIHFEAYADNAGNYTYELAFDACASACTPDPFSGTGVVVVDDNTVLAYDETEGNIARLMIDVTTEAQIASYTGGGTDMEAAIGYQVDRGTAVDSIASAMGKLVVTYEYDAYSTNLTNTVIYPLDSDAAGDSGSRDANQGGCTLDSNCPIFSYNVEIDESSFTRLDAWFDIGYQRDSGGTADTTYNINIEGDDTSSSTYNHESALAGAVGVDRDIYWSVENDATWAGGSGFAENTDQDLEIFVSGQNNYLLGGLVYETYTAARLTPTRTKTVRYPIGIVNANADTTEQSANVDVYFPEEGVDVKTAFVRVKTSLNGNASGTVTVSTEVGSNAQGGSIAYAMNPPNSNTKNSPELIHIIPSADYAELEMADATSAINVIVYTQLSNASQAGATSAELYITYTYTNDNNGWMSSISIFGGRQDTAPAQTFSQSDDSIDPPNPEASGTKTPRGASLDVSMLVSDSDGGFPTADKTMGAALDINADLPCTSSNTMTMQNDEMNNTHQYFVDVSSDFTDLSDTYTACYSTNGGGAGTAGGKFNSIFNYIYQWDRGPLKGAVMVVD